MNKEYKYQIAVSFSSEEREYVEEVVSFLQKKGISIFYDACYEDELMGKNIQDYLVKTYTEDVQFFSIIFISKSYGISDWTEIERKAIQSLAVNNKKKEEVFVIYTKFDDTKIIGVLSTDHITDLRETSAYDFANLIEGKLNFLKNKKKITKQLVVTQKNNILEGYTSPKDWFINWNRNISEPKMPDYDRFLYDTFIETEVYNMVLNRFLDGNRRVGITGMLGMGGVGKTYTAMKISDTLIREHQWKIVWISLLQQSSDEVLNQLAEQFNLYFVANLKVEEKTLAIKELYTLINRKFPRILVVLDNAEGYKGLEELVDIALSNTNILITSRERNYPMIPYISLEPFEEDKAIEYCKKILDYYFIDIKPERGDEDDLKRISQNVQGHPLALKLIMSKFIEQYTEYQHVPNRFNLLWKRLSNRGVLELNNIFDKASVKKNIRISFEWLYADLPNQQETYKKNAYYLLPIVSILGTSKVSLEDIKSGITYLISNSNRETEWVETFKNFNNTNNLRASLNYLKDISLLSERTDGIYSVHPLVREFSISLSEQKSEISNVDEEKIEEYINYVNKYKENISISFKSIEDIKKLEKFDNDATLNLIYKTFIYSKITLLPISKEKQENFSLLLLKSFSLNVSEKQRVIDSIEDGLTTHQAEELIKVWEGELDKFNELLKKHPTDIVKLLYKTYYENIEFLFNNISKENIIEKDIKIVKSPSSRQLFSMALEIVGKELYSDTLLDLLPRLKSHKQLMELSIKRIKSEYNTLYYKPNTWDYLEKILTISFDITKSVGLYDEYHWIGFMLGELRDRKESSDGKEILQRTIKSYIKHNASDKYGTIEPQMICDWAVAENKLEAIWSNLYIGNYLEDGKFNKNDLSHMMQTLRLLYSFNESYNRMKIFERYNHFITDDFLEQLQISLSAKNQNLISNIILDLSNWVKLKIRYTESMEFLKEVDVLVKSALANEKNLISQEHYIWYEVSKYSELFRFGLIELKTFDMNIGRLKNMEKENGIRGFALEAKYNKILAEKNIENGNYKEALTYITRAIELNELLDKKENILELKFFEIICHLFDKAYNIEMIEIELNTIFKKIKKMYLYELLPIYYLIKVIIFNKKDMKTENKKAYGIVIELYKKYLYYIPPYARNILRENQSWDNFQFDSNTIENLIPWIINCKKLPKRVISITDNREMILVESGIQLNENGKEVWMYPFYIDASPLQIEDLEQIDISSDILMNESLEKTISVNSNFTSSIAKKINKKIPSSLELFIAYQQIENNYKVEQWNDIDNALNKMYMRIEKVINTREPIEVDIDFDNIYTSPKMGDNNNIPFLTIEEFYKADWLMSDTMLKNKFDKVISEPFENLPVSSDKQKGFAFLLVNSLSLNKKEKLKVINSAKEGLSIFQCEELTKVFIKEKEKFTKLKMEHPEDINKLLENAYYEFLDLLGIFAITRVKYYYEWYTYTCIPYTDKWEKDEKITDTYVGLKEKPKNILPILRYIKPIFSKEDLKGLKPL